MMKMSTARHMVIIISVLSCSFCAAIPKIRTEGIVYLPASKEYVIQPNEHAYVPDGSNIRIMSGFDADAHDGKKVVADVKNTDNFANVHGGNICDTFTRDKCVDKYAGIICLKWTNFNHRFSISIEWIVDGQSNQTISTVQSYGEQKHLINTIACPGKAVSIAKETHENTVEVALWKMLNPRNNKERQVFAHKYRANTKWNETHGPVSAWLNDHVLSIRFNPICSGFGPYRLTETIDPVKYVHQTNTILLQHETSGVTDCESQQGFDSWATEAKSMCYKEGEDVTFKCPENQEDASYAWFKNNNKMPASSNAINIANVSTQDEGWYVCDMECGKYKYITARPLSLCRSDGTKTISEGSSITVFMTNIIGSATFLSVMHWS